MTLLTYREVRTSSYDPKQEYSILRVLRRRDPGESRELLDQSFAECGMIEAKGGPRLTRSHLRG